MGAIADEISKFTTPPVFHNYTVFSLWDTFRAAHPLYAIIDRKRTRDFIKTFLAQYNRQVACRSGSWPRMKLTR